ncbi:MAG: hypothetical protein GC204_16370 [Chloroflexi bacterium]|nr:hypothetical protein [Chloroflexota bacterium]
MMNTESTDKNKARKTSPPLIIHQPPLPPLTNYTLSTVCPSCGAPTHRLACKVRCPRCGFVWDCSEL